MPSTMRSEDVIMGEENKEDKKKEIEQKALQGAAAEVISRYGDAAKQHIVGYSGVDNELSVEKKMKKSLKEISEYSVNKDYEYANKKQQAGFSAEVKSVARKNADSIVKGDKARYIRSDDLGRVNDQLVDIAIKDANGVEITSLGSQMKFVGKEPKDLLAHLRSNKSRKYLEEGVFLAVPDDFYDKLIGEKCEPGLIDQEIDKLKKQLDAAKKAGKNEVVKQRKAQLEDMQKIKNKLRKSGLKDAEAMFAREHPKLSTAIDIGKLAHEAGSAQAKTGAAITGSLSVVRNVVACMKGEIEPQDAAIAVVKDTGKGAAFSYATAFSGSVIKGSMQNASSGYVRSLSRTNLASSLVSTTINVGKTITQYIKGELTGAQCVESLGVQGVGEIGSAMYASIALTAVQGTGSVAIKIIAGMAGSTLGYAAAVAVYQELATSLKDYELAVKERIRIEAECEEAVGLICQYRAEMNAAVEQYLTEHLETFNEGFTAMDDAIAENDVNGFITGNVMIQEKLGHEIQFRSQEEFENLMSSDVALKL